MTKAAAVVVFALLSINAFSSPSSAYRDYQAGDYKAALEEYNRLAQQKTNDYRLQYDAGAAAYRAKKLDDAAKKFNDALDSQGIIADPKTQENTYYNLGNTLYQMGESLPDPDKKKESWEHAVESLGRAYRLNTNDLDARNNLAFVKQKLEQLKQQQQQQQKQDQQKKDKQDNKDQKDQKDQQKQQNQKDQQGQKDQKDDQQKSQQADQKKQDEDKAKQQQAKKDGDKDKQQQQAQAGKPRDKDGQKPDDEEQANAAEATMSPQEARQLLDSQQDQEKVLIFSPENQPVKPQPGKFKDW